MQMGNETRMHILIDTHLELGLRLYMIKIIIQRKMDQSGIIWSNGNLHQIIFNQPKH